MSDSEIHHLGAAYVLDALDDRERVLFETHVASCGICRTDVRELRAAAAELSTLTATPPPTDLKARVLTQVATTRQLSPLPDQVVRLADRRRRPTAIALAAAAAVVVFAVGALVAGALDDDDFGEQLAAMMVEPDARTVRLAGDGGGTVTVVWAGGRAAVVADGLSDPGEGRAYELWAIDDAGAHPLRLLDDAGDGRVERIIEVDRRPTAFGVTIEPAAGSDVPTEPILFAATV
jgi:anti-sigma-K factor RskA